VRESDKHILVAGDGWRGLTGGRGEGGGRADGEGDGTASPSHAALTPPPPIDAVKRLPPSSPRPPETLASVDTFVRCSLAHSSQRSLASLQQNLAPAFHLSLSPSNIKQISTLQSISPSPLFHPESLCSAPVLSSPLNPLLYFLGVLILPVLRSVDTRPCIVILHKASSRRNHSAFKQAFTITFALVLSRTIPK
jgi:hypothetical protein